MLSIIFDTEDTEMKKTDKITNNNDDYNNINNSR